MCGLEDKKDSKDQGKRGGWKVKIHRKERKKKQIEYFWKLWDKVLAEDATLLENTKGLWNLNIRKLPQKMRRDDGSLKIIRKSNQQGTMEMLWSRWKC